MMSLRQRNRHNAMRTTQRAALEMFIDRGFDAVTVDSIAAEVGMAASTLYRHFSTKEAIVLWDEHDAGVDDALGRALGHGPPLPAIREVFVEEVGGRYDADEAFQLRRVRFIYATAAVHGAALEQDLRDREELTAALTQVMSKKGREAAPLIAGAAMLALDVAFDRWQNGNGARPLGRLIDESFAHLGHLDELG